VPPKDLEGPLSIIALAVTPAVMISATAILIGTVSAKHAAMADRLRSLMAEYRMPDVTAQRRRNIEEQCRLFQRRLKMTTNAHLSLYLAAAFFVLMVLAIGISSSASTSQLILYPLFLAGTLSLGYGVVLEVMELRLADRTLELEVADAGAAGGHRSHGPTCP
jgi:hypothetical protein